VSNLSEALRLAALGLHVFPLQPGRKEPLGSEAPHGQDDATTDPEIITGWWTRNPTANVGIATALSGLYVVDVDSHGTRKDGTPKVGGESWAALTAGRTVPQTYTVRTQSGSTHLYFQMPTPPLRNTASKLAPDIDTRGNGYVVAPPSTVNGNPYVVIDSSPVAVLPDWIAELLRPAPRVHRPPTPPNGPQPVHAPADEVMGRIRQLADELGSTPDGYGNETAARIAFMVGGYVGAGQVDETTAVGVLLDAIAGWGYADPADAGKMENTIIRQVAEGSKHPRPWEAARFQDGGTAASSVTEAEEELPSKVTDWGTDDGQARYLLKFIGGMLYVIGIGWHLWDGQRWLAVDERRIGHVVKSHYKSRFDHHIGRYTSTMDVKWNQRAEMFKAFMKSSRLSAILSAMERIEPVEADQLDAHPELLNTPAGVVNLRTGEVGKHDPKLLMTKVTKGNYLPGYRHPDWDGALRALPEEVVDYFQLRVGQAATGYIPESDDCLILQGNGANGKSLMTSDGVMRALGDYAMLASPALILSKDASGGATPERASVRGARFVLIEELPEGRSLSIEELKRIIGTSSITARKLYKDEMTFTTSHTLFVTTNYLPAVNETDDGAWRRLCLVPFPYRFDVNPSGPDERLGDPGMKRRVREGAEGQHDAIVTWTVEGARRYLANPTGIMAANRPAMLTENTKQWRMRADRIMAYLDARMVPDVDGMVAKPDLYSDFCAYLQEQGHTKWSQETFFERFSKHELWRRFAMTEGQTRNASALSRPALPEHAAWSSSLPKLPNVPRVVRGIRFRDAGDDYGTAAA
jgi:P4 family phage/plasmid primase-like protien